MFRRFSNAMPIINFCVSSTALYFQVFVLNPWHKQISGELNNLKKAIETFK